MLKLIQESEQRCMSATEIRKTLLKQGIVLSEERLKVILVKLIEEEKLLFDFIQKCYRPLLLSEEN